MKRLIQNIIIFILILFVLDRMIGMSIEHVNRRTTVADNGRNNIINQEMLADIVVLGSSRALHHYNPQIFEDSLDLSCYNAGTDGQGILLNYAHFALFTKRYNPQLIIYDVQPSFDIWMNDNTRYLKWLKPYYGDSCIKEIFMGVQFEECIKMNSRLYRYNNNVFESIRDYFNSKRSHYKDNGYNGLDGKMEYDAPEIKSLNYDIDSLKLKYFEKLIVECKAKGIKLILYFSPVFKLGNLVDYGPILDLAEKYMVPIKNHLCDSAFCGNKNLFVDSQHMNKEGALSYSVIVTEEIKKYL